ncbi:MAG: hypothetical protein KatS3mg108_3452 [Isosphaeraceae bacterium]|jgi:transcriptional regulator with XRE-family HTH domain|nr:MAG: hypothetical protein KatS3mg108_3452 [Isosphaeraceae bacterium]
MTFAEKVYRQMVRQGLNQQRLAKLSSVSDSEVSRVLRGKSSPSLEYAFRIAKALGVSLDYLADDQMEQEPVRAGEGLGPTEREILELVRELGPRQARRILETALDLGYEVATRRLLGLDTSKPVVEPDDAARAAARSGPPRASLA